ncbi:SCO6880 family protein [Streptomyces sp. NPDC004520]|uniref:SCO6880 family protein n=1 Tax=Streptomyces sp. NPDC004520 TaxID=3364702 RepID=UPI00367F53DA
MASQEPVRYGGWQSEQSGWMGNLSGSGFLLMALAIASALVPIYQRSLSAATVFIPLALVLLALAFGRVQGLTADEWIVLAVRHHIAVATGRNRFISGLWAPRTREGEQPMDLPGTLARLRILDASNGLSGRIGIVYDPHDRTYSAIAKVSFGGLALVDTATQNARIAAWAAFLRAHCKEDSPFVRIAVHQRSLPDDGEALRSWTLRHLSPTAPDASVQVLGELMLAAGPGATVRETYLTLTLAAQRARLAIRGAGGGQRGAAAVLVRELNARTSLISSAGLQVEEWLDQRAVAATIRTAYDPDAQLMIAERKAAAHIDGYQGTAPGVDPELAGPAAAETSAGSYAHDGAWTVSYQVRGLPHGEVYGTVLQPLLRPRMNARRSLSIVYEPLGPARARRELAREKTKRQSARQLRAKSGRSESEDERREALVAQRQDRARAAGQGVVRLTAVIAVTVTDLAQLETACAELQSDASDAGLELRRAWFTQDSVFAAAAMPLGQGLADKRMTL